MEINNDFLAEANKDYPTIAEYFAHKTVALTGGTGFLGQSVIEKLLRCCPEIKKIILLIRTKKDVGPDQRLKELASSSAFDVLREINPKFAEKLACVPCQLEADQLGLDAESVRTLAEEVNVFIHSAATLKFNEHLRLSYELNTKCVRRMLTLCKRLPYLQSLVHISTAYTNCNRSDIKEDFYDPGMDYLDLENTLRWMDDETITKITPNLLGKRPNTYTYTKALAEDVIRRESGHLPVCIIRPSMITPALNEPAPGWTSNVYGPTGFLIAYQKGILRSFIADRSADGDIIPVDFVVNAVISAAMKTGCDFKEQSVSHHDSAIGSGSESSSLDGNTCCSDMEDYTEENAFDEERRIAEDYSLMESTPRNSIPIYNITTGKHNKISVGELSNFLIHWGLVHPSSTMLYPRVFITANRAVHNVITFFTLTVPCYAGDALRSLLMKKRRLVKLNSSIAKAVDVMAFFFMNSFDFDNEKADILRDSLHPKDKEAFNFHAGSFHWCEYMEIYVKGVTKFILKHNEMEMEAQRAQLRRLKIMEYILGGTVALGTAGYAAANSLPESVWEMYSYATELF